MQNEKRLGMRRSKILILGVAFYQTCQACPSTPASKNFFALESVGTHLDSWLGTQGRQCKHLVL